MPDPETLSLRHRLRQHTASAHAALDARMSAYAVATRPGYQRFLTTLARVLPACEGLLEASAVETLLPDWPQRVRRHALAADLAGLGQRVDPVPLPWERLSPAEALGMLYVLEGSRLGGQLLLREVRTSPDAAIGENIRYLTHGEKHLWPGFVRLLDATPAAQAEPALAMAEWTFALFTQASQSTES